MTDFVHLHVHTTYSLLDGQCQVNALVERARRWNMPALAVTDHGNLFALKAFYDACRNTKKNFEGLPPIKPILGCEAYVTSTGDYTTRDASEKRHHLILLAKNLVGYHNLVRLISEAHIHGFYNRPRIDVKLLEKYHEGLICSSACIAGEVSRAIDAGHMDEAERVVRWYQNLFGDDYYLEVMLHDSVKTEIPYEAREDMRALYARQQRVIVGMKELSAKFGIPIVATNDVHFLDAEDDDSHDVLLCLSTGKTLSDAKRMIYTGQEWFKDGDAMAALFPDNPEFLTNTLALAAKIETYELDSAPIMPKFPIPSSFGTEEGYAKKFDEDALKREFNVADKLGKLSNYERLGGYEKVLRIKFEADYLASLVWAGVKRRWGGPAPQAIVERVQFELDTIRTMGFPGYFLIVHDYIAAARSMGVWVGPGRGSAAGAAVAYALGITNVDPIKFDLLFERFLNPDRISMPDIDVDFDDDGRARVLDYVTKKYGADHVAHIVTFGQMAAKSAIKDVGRVMEYPLGDTNKLASLVPDTPKITFQKAIKSGEAPELKKAFDSEDPTIHKLMERARRLEGSIRQPGVHACGVIISRDPIIDTLPVMPTEGENLLTTQYDGHFVEPVGLLKMDFLGLKTLSVEKECLALIKQFRTPEELTQDTFGRTLDTDQIPDDDVQTYKLFGRGETTGLFQFESEGMKKWLMALQPERLTDLVAMNALYRPGPMEYIPTFVARKQGKEPVTYDHPLMVERLKDTYGVTVYQEQVMLLSRDLAGFTRGESDKLRKAMGKKQIDTMNELKVKFIKGCLANPEFVKGTVRRLNGIELNADKSDVLRDVKGNPDKSKSCVYENLDLTNPDDAKVLILKIWADWEAFASYAFNKSHAVCYAWVAYQTGYLKAHYPAEFMCAQISSEIGNFDKLPGFVSEAAEMGLEVLPPDVNEAYVRFSPVHGKKAIRFGMAGIKGVGAAAAEAIVAERTANGPYKGLLDLAMRLADKQVVNKRVLENLIKCGACDGFCSEKGHFHRARFFHNVDFVLRRAQSHAKDLASGQTDFFALMGSGKSVDDADLPDCPVWPPAECFRGEIELTGIYLTGHPLGVWKDVLKTLSTYDLGKMNDLPLGTRLDVRVAGIIEKCDVRYPRPDPANPKKNLNPWAIVSIDDGSIKTEANCYSKSFEKYPWLTDASGVPALFCGQVKHRSRKTDDFDAEGRPIWVETQDVQFVINEIYPLEEGVRQFAERIVFRFNRTDPKLAEKVTALTNLAKSHPGATKLSLELQCENGAVAEIDASSISILPSQAFLMDIKRMLPGCVYRIVCRSDVYLDEANKPKFRKFGS